MIRLLADENFNGHIVRGLLRRRPTCDPVRVQDVGLSEVDDAFILQWAAANDRILLTHDRATMPDVAYERLLLGQSMPGVFVVPDWLSSHQVIEELLLIDEISEQSEWANLVAYLPL